MPGAGASNRAAFDPQPTLAGELLRLRPLRAEDFEALFRVAADPLIWEQHPEPERCQEPVFRKFFRDALDSRDEPGVSPALAAAPALRGVRQRGDPARRAARAGSLLQPRPELFIATDYFVGQRIPAVASARDSKSGGEIVRSVVAVAIWLPYMLKSRRVRNTLLAPRVPVLVPAPVPTEVDLKPGSEEGA